MCGFDCMVEGVYVAPMEWILVCFFPRSLCCYASTIEGAYGVHGSTDCMVEGGGSMERMVLILHNGLRA